MVTDVQVAKSDSNLGARWCQRSPQQRLGLLEAVADRVPVHHEIAGCCVDVGAIANERGLGVTKTEHVSSAAHQTTQGASNQGVDLGAAAKQHDEFELRVAKEPSPVSGGDVDSALCELM